MLESNRKEDCFYHVIKRLYMIYAEFDKRLKEVNLSKKEFAKLVNMQYESVVNWKRAEKIPDWVKSWLYYYEKSKILDTLITSIEKLDKE